MAPAGRDGERTRFPFLATVRSLVAIVVTVLAVSVVVMVIAVIHRPVDMGLLSWSHVHTEDLWWQNKSTPEAARATATPSYKPAKEVVYLILVKALNLSGRGRIHGNITGVRILDMPDASFTGTVQFDVYRPDSPVRFDLPAQSSHRFRSYASIKDPAVLQYLYDKHRQDGGGFRAMLVVEATYKPAHSKKSINATYYCWPVTFLCTTDVNTPTAGDVLCKTTQEMGYPVSWKTLPPPSPVPPRHGSR